MPNHRHVPTDNQRGQVEAYAAVGMRHDYISALIGVDKKTLYRWYRVELDRGKAKGVGKAARKLFSMVENDKHPKQLGAICFYLKCQGGWRETAVLEVNDNRESAKARDTADEGSDADAAKAYKAMLEVGSA